MPFSIAGRSSVTCSKARGIILTNGLDGLSLPMGLLYVNLEEVVLFYSLKFEQGDDGRFGLVLVNTIHLETLILYSFWVLSPLNSSHVQREKG